MSLQGKHTKQIRDEMPQTYCDSGPSYTVAKRRVVKLKTGRFDVES